jgi:hypothetical protein
VLGRYTADEKKGRKKGKGSQADSAGADGRWSGLVPGQTSCTHGRGIGRVAPCPFSRGGLSVGLEAELRPGIGWSQLLECTPSRRHVTVSLSPWSKLLALDVSIVFSL